MARNTKIEWSDTSWNPVRGCSRVSEGCRNCYAETVANRFKGRGLPYEGLIASGGQWNGTIKLMDSLLGQPLTWRKPQRIFVNSMSDLFHENIPFEFIASVFAVMSVTTRHTYQILTKRPKRMLEFFDWALQWQDIDGEWLRIEPFDMLAGDRISDHWPSHLPWKGYDNCGPAFPFENVWLGVSVEDQLTAEERIPQLLATPAALRFISLEPMLEEVDITDLVQGRGTGNEHHFNSLSMDGADPADDPWNGALIKWVIAGGESGPGARPVQADWIRSVRDQCQTYDVPFFFKQWGEFAPNWLNKDGEKVEGSEWMDRLGKKVAGRALDDLEHSAFPTSNS